MSKLGLILGAVIVAIVAFYVISKASAKQLITTAPAENTADISTKAPIDVIPRDSSFTVAPYSQAPVTTHFTGTGFALSPSGAPLTPMQVALKKAGIKFCTKGYLWNWAAAGDTEQCQGGELING